MTPLSSGIVAILLLSDYICIKFAPIGRESASDQR